MAGVVVLPGRVFSWGAASPLAACAYTRENGRAEQVRFEERVSALGALDSGALELEDVSRLVRRGWCSIVSSY